MTLAARFFVTHQPCRMTTTLTLCAAPRGRETLLERSFPPSSSLSSALEALASASNVSPPYSFKVYNPEGDLLNVTPQRSVGTQPLCVEIEASVIHGLRIKAEQQDVQISGLVKQMTAAASIHLKVCAGQIMQTALGAPFIQTYSVSEPAVQQLAGLARLSPEAFVEQADQLLDRQNNTAAHQQSVEQLDALVVDCQEMITPALRAKHKWESWVVESYAEIKKLLAFQYTFANTKSITASTRSVHRAPRPLPVPRTSP